VKVLQTDCIVKCSSLSEGTADRLHCEVQQFR